jgi:hypothetical protein
VAAELAHAAEQDVVPSPAKKAQSRFQELLSIAIAVCWLS